MSQLTKSELERVVRAFWKRQEAPKEVRKPLQSARAMEKLTTDWLRSTGFDFTKARKLQERARAEWDRDTPRAAAAAARRLAGHIRRTQASAAAWATDMMAAAGGAPPGNSFFVDRPVNILATDAASLKDRHIEAGKSFAKVLGDRRSSVVDRYSFIFGFGNRAATPFLFTFDTLLNVSGILRLNAGGGFNNGGTLRVDATLDVLTDNQVSDVRNVAVIAALGGFPANIGAGGTAVQNVVSLTRFLTAPGIVMEGNSLAVILVSLVLRYEDLDDTHVVADFNTGTFGVLCPVVFAARSALPLKASGGSAAGVAF